MALEAADRDAGVPVRAALTRTQNATSGLMR